MPIRNYPFSQFNFTVEWDGLNGNSVQAGFQEVSGLGMEITVAEYRAGNSQTNEPLKITGAVKTPDVTLKRGVIGSLDLYEWLHAVRDGSQDQLKTVKITMLSEERKKVITWILKGARPMKFTGPSFNAKGTDLAIEELVLAAERIEMEEAAAA